MAELNIYARKEFDIILSDGRKISGKFGTWSNKRLCDKKGIDLFELIIERQKWIKKVTEHNEKSVMEALASGLTENDAFKLPYVSFSDLCSRVLCAVEYKAYKDKKGFAYTDVDVCEWLEELGEKVAELIKLEDSEIEQSSNEDTGAEKKS